MMILPSIAFHRAQYEQQGFTIMMNRVRPAFISRMVRTVIDAGDSDLIEGDDSDHSWKEINLEPPLALTDLLHDIDLPAIIGGAPSSMEHWLNVYEEGEYIGTHVDAGGDAQLMIPIALPPIGQGGHLWIDAKDKTLPIAVGDVLVFAAHRLRHGTTPVLEGRRISFNGRMWLS